MELMLHWIFFFFLWSGCSDEEYGVSDDSISNDGESGPRSDREGSDGESDAEDSGDQDGKSEEEQNDAEENPNAGWAEAMAKILGKKTPDSKPSILLKNKELDKIKEKEKKERLEKKKQVNLTLGIIWPLAKLGFTKSHIENCEQ